MVLGLSRLILQPSSAQELLPQTKAAWIVLMTMETSLLALPAASPVTRTLS